MKAQTDELPARAVTWQNLEPRIKAIHPRLLSLCRRILKDEGDAEDAVQEALINAFKEIDQLRDPSRLEGWLRRIASWEALKIAKKRARIPIESLEQLQEDHAWEVPDPTLTPEEIVVGGGGYALHVWEVMERVCSDQEKAVIKARYQPPRGQRRPLSFQEIAEMLDLPEGTVRSHWTRGRRKILRALEAEKQ